jgi:hypothetical protein
MCVYEHREFCFRDSQATWRCVKNTRTAPGIRISPSPYIRDDSSNLAGDRLVAYPGHDLIGFVDFDLSVVVGSQVSGEAHTGIEVLGFIDVAGGKLDGGVDPVSSTSNSRFNEPKSRISISPPRRPRTGAPERQTQTLEASLLSCLCSKVA